MLPAVFFPQFFLPLPRHVCARALCGRYEHDQKRKEVHRMSEVFRKHEGTEGWVVQVSVV